MKKNPMMAKKDAMKKRVEGAGLLKLVKAGGKGSAVVPDMTTKKKPFRKGNV